MKYFIFSLITLFVIFLVHINTFAQEETHDIKTTTLNLVDLVSEAKKYNINVIDWRNIQKVESTPVNLKTLVSQKDWLEFLKRKFSGSYSLVSSHSAIKMYLLPKGVNRSFIQQAKQIANEEDINSNFISFKNATQLKNAEILKIPEVIALEALSSIEKSKTISYQRLINPKDMKSSYDFKVQYIDQLQMMLPIEKNGNPVNEQMESFSSFNTFYNFIDKKTQDLEAWRFQERIYLKFKGDESMMMLCGSVENMQVASRIIVSNSPRLEIFLKGNKNEFKSITNIYHDKGPLKYVDIANIHQ